VLINVHTQFESISVDLREEFHPNISVKKYSADYLAHLNACFTLMQDWYTGQPLFAKSSGSTGKPKIIELLREKLLISVQHSTIAFQLSGAELFIVAMPVDYIAGKLQLIRALTLGADVYILPPSLVEIRPLDTEKLNFIALTPSQLCKVLNRNLKNELNFLNHSKAIIIGGAALSTEQFTQIQKQLNCPVYHTYGMTETYTHIAIKEILPIADEHYYVLNGVEIAVNDQHQLMINSAITNNVWLVTNDVVELSGVNKFKVLYRIDSVINSGGVKLFPQQIEEEINKIILDNGLNVTEFYISSISDDKLGEQAVFVYLEQDKIEVQKLIELITYHSFLQKYARPRHFIKVSSFPKTETMKINRLALNKQICML